MSDCWRVEASRINSKSLLLLCSHGSNATISDASVSFADARTNLLIQYGGARRTKPGNKTTPKEKNVPWNKGWPKITDWTKRALREFLFRQSSGDTFHECN